VREADAERGGEAPEDGMSIAFRWKLVRVDHLFLRLGRPGFATTYVAPAMVPILIKSGVTFSARMI
jgi:hypothetical protein